MSIGKKTAIPPSQTLSDFCWNERPFPHLRTDPIPIGSIWLYMFMYDICMIYIYCIHIVDSWVLHIRNYSVHGCDVVCGLLMGARISMNLTYWVINELLFGKNEWIVDMALNKALLLGDC